MGALLILAIYVVPFLVVAIAIKRWMDRSGVDLDDVQAEGGPRKRSRFFLGVWRHDDRS